MAAFVAEQTIKPGVPIEPWTEVFRMTDPLGGIIGTSICTVQKVPLKLVSAVKSKAASDTCSKGPGLVPPAFANRTPTPPWAFCRCARSLDLADIQNITAECLGVLSDLPNCRIERRLVASGDDDFGALGSEAQISARKSASTRRRLVSGGPSRIQRGPEVARVEVLQQSGDEVVVAQPFRSQ
jgi:hypothetical protein